MFFIMMLLIKFVVVNTYSNVQLILLAEHKLNTVDINCVISNNSVDSALIWIKSDVTNTKDIAFSTYRPESILIEDFKEIKTFEEWTVAGWKIGDSKQHLFYFVADRRWEDLPIWKDVNQPKRFIYNPQDTFNIGFSIYIKIGNTPSVERVDREKYVKENLKCLKEGIPLTQLSTWEHVNILLKNDVLIIEGNNNVCETGIQIKPNDHLIFNLKTTDFGILKFHEYQFLWANTAEHNWHQIGPLIYNKYKKNCVVMYVALCKTCYLKIKIIDENNNLLYHEQIGKIQTIEGKYVWKRLNIFIKDAYNIKINITRENANNSLTGFWAIDDIHFADRNAIQVATAAVNYTELHQWQCYNLNYADDNIYQNIRSNNAIGVVNNVCPLIFESQPFCEKNLICTVGNSFGSQCYCVPGYYGKKCDQERLKVENLTVYSKDEKSVSLRWKIPLEDVDTYNITSCSVSLVSSAGSRCEYHLVTPRVCELWEDSNCFSLVNLRENRTYTIEVLAKSMNIHHPGETSKIENIITKQDVCDEVVINSNWENDTFILNWQHPCVTNGLIRKFNISFIANESEYENSSFTLTIPVTKIQNNYSYEIQNFRNATRYNIEIYAVNKYRGKCSTITIISPPPIPDFQEKPALSCENNTCSIKVGLPYNLISKSFLWTMIDIKSSFVIANSFQKTENFGNYTNIILNKFNIAQEDQWTVLKTNLDENVKTNISDQKIVVAEIIFDRESRSKIHIVLLNDFDDQIEMKTYTLTYPDDVKYNIIKYDYISVKLETSLIICIVIITFIMLSLLLCTYKKSEQSSKQPAIKKLGRLPENSTSVSVKLKLDHYYETPSQEVTKPLIPTVDEYLYPFLIQRTNFENYLKNSVHTEELEKQFKLLFKGRNKSCEYGVDKHNHFKNRQESIIAYDATRVKLEVVNDDQYSDYINANFINGYNQPKAYIATQGPKSTTINDFWRMVWQENIKTIVMLTNLTEGDQKKCEQYWPNLKDTEEYGEITGENLRENVFVNYVHRTLILTKGQEKSAISHFHFTAWPDHSIPLHPQSLVPFIKKICKEPPPILVHCSTGIGRTGTFLLVLYNLTMVNAIGTLRFFETVQQFRQQRPDMIENLKQYKLVHFLVYEALFGLDTEIPCDDNFEASVRKLMSSNALEMSMKRLNSIRWQNYFLRPNHSEDARTKNRFLDILPWKENYIFLGPNPYRINVVSVNQFETANKFIVTQQPSSATVSEFWNMILSNGASVIVSLNEIRCSFWPEEKGKILKPLPSVALSFIEEDDEIFRTTVILLQKFDKNDTLSKKITIISMHDWHSYSNVPNSIDHILLVLQGIENAYKTAIPIVVTCHDGITSSGLFVALSFVTEQIKMSKICNICEIVQLVRYSHQQFIRDKEQLQYLYVAALNYFLDSTVYSKIKE